MPDETVVSARRQPVMVTAVLYEPGAAHARVTSRGLDEREAVLGSDVARVAIVGAHDEIRQLLGDAVAQLDAIADLG